MHRNAFRAVPSKWSNATLQQVCKHEIWTLWSPQRSGVRCRYTRNSDVLLLFVSYYNLHSFFLHGFCLFLTLFFLPLLLPCTSYFFLLFTFFLFLLSLPCAVLTSPLFQDLILTLFLVSIFVLSSCLSLVFILPVFLLSQLLYPTSSSFSFHYFQVTKQGNKMTA